MNKSIFKLFGMSALVLSAILGGLSIADRPLVLEAHALSREQEKGVDLDQRECRAVFIEQVV